MDYKKLWTDMHSNLHYEQIEVLPMWLERVREMMSLWPIAYYPSYMKSTG